MFRQKNQVSPRGRHRGSVDMDSAVNASVLGAVPFAHASSIGESLDIRWYRHKLKERVCNRFVLSETASVLPGRQVCECGYYRNDHPERAIRNGNQPLPESREVRPTSAGEQGRPGAWVVDNDTFLQPTSAFGELEFVGYGQKISKFARVANDTPMPILLDLLIKQWNLEKPNMVISVTGGAKNFTMKSRLKQVFNQGLMKAAKSTSAWIITGGMHAGVMKHVGEAVRTSELSAGSKNKATVIGIAPWGCVANRTALISHEGKWPAQYVLDAAPAPNESPLDMNHSHFILVDNGTQYKFATEIPLRAELEAAIGNLKSGFDVVSVPRVCVLLEGGPGSLETVTSAIENDTPAVVVDGSGRSADVIAFAFQNAKEIEEEYEENGEKLKRVKLILSQKTREQVRKMLINIFGDSPNMETWLSWVDKCIKNKDMLTIFSLDSKSGIQKDIDLSLLTALLKAKKNRIQDQLKLALAWNRIDIAKNQIFSKDRQWKQHELFELMTAALKLGREDFVSLFLENGINMKQFLTVGRLMELYNNIPKNNPLHHMLRKIEKDSSTPFQLRDVGYLIKDLMGDYYEPLYLTKKYKNADKDVSTFNKAFMEEAYATEWDESMADFPEPSRELFIWAVLMNLKTMATLLWVDAKDPMAGALTACKLLKSMANRMVEADLKQRYEETAEEFQALAIAVLQECYLADDGQAEHLLIREQPNFGHTTCLQLAVHGKNEDFVAHPCVQMLLSRIWKGKISPDNRWWRFVLCIMFMPLIFALLYYREDEAHSIRKRNDKNDKKAMLQRSETTVSGENNKHSGKMKVRHQESKVLDFYDIGRPLTFLERLKYFYTAPIVVFTFNCISYLSFLVLFSFDLMVSYSSAGPDVVEIIMVIWVVTLLCEELRQLIADGSDIRLSLKLYFSRMLNIVDIVTITLFFMAFIMRFFAHTFEAPRYIMCLSLGLFFCRLLHIFSVFKQLGPILIMIQRMLKDLFWFLLIIIVFLVAYGVIRQAILYPQSPFTGMLVYTMLRSSYWQMQGEIEYFLGETEDVNGNCTLENGVLSNCSVPQLLVPPIMAIYILFTNVLMFNLLIAMFNYTYTQIQDNTDRVWSFQRYFLIQEYYERPPIPPPFIIFFHMWLIARSLLSLCWARFRKPWKDDIRLTYTTPEDKIREKQLILWENMNADEYARKRSLIELETTEYKIQETRFNVEHLHVKIDTLQEQFQNIGQADKTEEENNKLVEDKRHLDLQKKVEVLEEKLDRSNESLEWIIRHLTSRSSRKSSPKMKGKDGADVSQKVRRAARRSLMPMSASRWPDLFDVDKDFSEYLEELVSDAAPPAQLPEIGEEDA